MDCELKQKAIQLAKYFHDHWKYMDAVPVIVEIHPPQTKVRYFRMREPERWSAVKYNSRTDHPAPLLYCLGKLPKAYEQKTRDYPGGPSVQKFYYRDFNSKDPGDWYIGCYYQEQIKPEIAEYHPFGISFQLHRWDLIEPIDASHITKTPRLPLIVKEIADGL